jgi:hypothetical protein
VPIDGSRFPVPSSASEAALLRRPVSERTVVY